MTVQTDAVALDEVVSAAILALPEAAGRVAVDVPEDLPLVSGDRGLLHRVLVNVIENALRHGASTEPIEVSATAGGTRRESRSPITGAGSSPSAPRRCSSRFNGWAITTVGSDSVSRSRAGSSRQWAARWSPTRRPAGA